MATDSMVAGLFSTPEQYQQAQSQAALNRGVQLAQLDPLQAARAQMYQGGYQLGGAIGGALGGQDPMLQLQSMRQQVLQGMDPTDSQSIMKAAQQLAQFDPNSARQLAQSAQEVALKQSQITKNLRTSSTTVSERNREMIANAEIKLAKKETLSPEEEARVRWLIGQENKPKIFRDSDTGEITTIEPIDLMTSAPNLATLVGKTAATAQPSMAQEGGVTATKAPAGVIGTVTTTPATKLPASIKKEVGTVDEQMTILDSSITKINALTPKIDNLNLGLYQNVERGVSAFLGKPTADTKEFKQLRRAVLEQANNLLLLAKGTQTEGDAQRARDQIADEDTWKNRELLTSAFDDLKATLTNTKEALKAKRSTLTSSGIPAIPGLGEGDIAPNRSNMSGMNPQLQPAAETPTAPKGKPITQDVMNKANDAIKRGAPRDAVMKRLKDQGYAVQ
jgi:hypothetical protein